MRSSALIITVLATTTVGGTAIAQQTSTDYGSAVYQTVRDCAPDAATPCDGRESIVARFEAGGAGQATTLGAPNAGLAYGSVSFGAFGFPEIKASLSASGSTRIGNNIFAYQSYLYTGDSELDLLLAGNFHIVNSTTDNGNGTSPGGGFVTASFAIWNKADFFGSAPRNFGATPASIYNRGFLFGTSPCEAFAPEDGDVSPRASSAVRATLTGGEANIGIAQTNCGEETLTLYRGDEFVIATSIGLFGNRGATIDATSTFTLGLSPDIDPASAAAFRRGVSFASPAPVPEPAGWALMIAGFGLTGAVLRRRQQRVSATA